MIELFANLLEAGAATPTPPSDSEIKPCRTKVTMEYLVSSPLSAILVVRKLLVVLSVKRTTRLCHLFPTAMYGLHKPHLVPFTSVR